MAQEHRYEIVKNPPMPGFVGDLDTIDMNEARQRFADLLGLDAPVSQDVLIGAIEDPLYATHLFASRDAPQFFEMLTANPPKAALATEKSPGQLLLQFSRSMKEWGKAGFRRASKEIVDARLTACMNCQHLQGPTGSILKKLASIAGMGDHTCGLCGCVVQAKANIATETCPKKDPVDSSLTPWSRAEATLAR